ncbi:hypothetical protein ACJZ2D_005109 [Fusarium nematophilum]
MWPKVRDHGQARRKRTTIKCEWNQWAPLVEHGRDLPSFPEARWEDSKKNSGRNARDQGFGLPVLGQSQRNLPSPLLFLLLLGPPAESQAYHNSTLKLKLIDWRFPLLRLELVGRSWLVGTGRRLLKVCVGCSRGLVMWPWLAPTCAAALTRWSATRRLKVIQHVPMLL